MMILKREDMDLCDNETKHPKRMWKALYDLLRWAGLQVLMCGPVPEHVAMIMDGNRRFADRAGIDRKSGHAFGFESLLQTLQLCLDLGIRYVSVYAFSIDNFGRSPDEVSALMELMREKLDLLVSEEGMAKERGIKVRVIGNLGLLPADVRASVDRAMAATRDSHKAVLNICVAYTSTAEIVYAMKQAVGEVLGIGESDSSLSSSMGSASGITEVDSEPANSAQYGNRRTSSRITKEDIERHLYTAGCPPPDLLIRTSGETRLSNFMLWQCCHSYLAFCKVLWPEFSFRHFFWIIMEYQRNYRHLVDQRMLT